MPFKSLFVLSRYLNWLPRYKDSKYWRLKQGGSYEWGLPSGDLYIFPGNAYYVFPGIASAACLDVGIGQ